MYDRVRDLRPEVSSSLNAYLLAFGALFLARFDLISGIDGPGVSVTADAIEHVLLLAWAYLQFRFSYLYSKLEFLTRLFDAEFEASPSTRRAVLLAKYPSAFLFMRYYPAVIGSLPKTFRGGFPIKALLAIAFMLLGLAIYAVVSTWLLISTAIDLWSGQGSVPSSVSVGVIATAMFFIIAAWLLPTGFQMRRRYTHHGLVDLLNRFHANRHSRWKVFASHVDDAERKLGLRRQTD